MTRGFRGFLGNTPAFLLTCLLLAAIAATSVYFFLPDLNNWTQAALHRPDSRAEMWQRWATHYAGLFGMLPYPARVGIQYEGERASGVLIDKSASGLNANRWTVLAKGRPGLVFILDATAQQHLLDKLETRPPNDIWQMMKDDLYASHIHIWYDPDLEWLSRGGYLRLMRDIDTRPEQLQWKDVKSKLGEPPG